MNMANTRIGHQNFLDREQQPVIACNRSLAGKSPTYRLLLFDNHPPFTLIAIVGGAIVIPACPEII